MWGSFCPVRFHGWFGWRRLASLCRGLAGVLPLMAHVEPILAASHVGAVVLRILHLGCGRGRAAGAETWQSRAKVASRTDVAVMEWTFEVLTFAAVARGDLRRGAAGGV